MSGPKRPPEAAATSTPPPSTSSIARPSWSASRMAPSCTPLLSRAMRALQLSADGAALTDVARAGPPPRRGAREGGRGRAVPLGPPPDAPRRHGRGALHPGPRDRRLGRGGGAGHHRRTGHRRGRARARRVGLRSLPPVPGRRGQPLPPQRGPHRQRAVPGRRAGRVPPRPRRPPPAPHRRPRPARRRPPRRRRPHAVPRHQGGHCRCSARAPPRSSSGWAVWATWRCSCSGR